jgi:hypothetical protein
LRFRFTLFSFVSLCLLPLGVLSSIQDRKLNKGSTTVWVHFQRGTYLAVLFLLLCGHTPVR